MSIERVAYAVTYVADLARMVRFYHETLGLPLLERSERFVAFGGAGAPLALESGGPPADGPRPKERNPTLVQFAVADIAASVEELRARGVQFEGEIRRGPYGALAFFRDPEGNRLALLERRATNDERQGTSDTPAGTRGGTSPFIARRSSLPKGRWRSSVTVPASSAG